MIFGTLKNMLKSNKKIYLDIFEVKISLEIEIDWKEQ